MIDVDMKLHTKDFGGKFSYPDAETDTRTDGMQRFLRTAGGEVYGLVKDGRIYLDPKVATAETAVHEYTHLWGRYAETQGFRAMEPHGEGTEGIG